MVILWILAGLVAFVVASFWGYLMVYTLMDQIYKRAEKLMDSYLEKKAEWTRKLHRELDLEEEEEDESEPVKARPH